MRPIISILFFLFVFTHSYAGEKDTTLHKTYRNQVVLYSYTGFHSAPFNIKDDFNLGVKRIYYKHNLRPILGFGIAYKWLKIRFGVGLPINIRSTKKYGTSKYTSLGLSLNTKQVYWNANFKQYNGYVISDSYKWNSNFSKDSSDFRTDISTVTLSIDAWHFKTTEFRMPATVSSVDDINSSKGSIFHKYSINIFGIGSDSLSITPVELIDTTKTRSFANRATSLNFALIPGYSYIYKHKNFRVAGVAGVGLALQARFYESKGVTRGFLGLAPRVDLRLLAGYSVDKYFVMLVSSFEYQNIIFKEMKYNQKLFSIYLVGGFRFDKKDKSKRKG